MDIVELTSQEYKQVLGGVEYEFFSSERFLELNKDRVDKIHYLLGRDSKPRFAFAVGEAQKKWLAPFSAPFAEVINLQKSYSVDKYWEFIEAFNNYAKSQNAESVEIYLPADCYDHVSNTILINALLGTGYRLVYLDINYSINLNNINVDTYPNDIKRNARKNLRIALNSNLELAICESKEQKEKAYEIIRINRESRGFPLRMTCEQLMNTIGFVDHRFFLVKHEEETIAAAVVYHLNNKHAQVIYWGEIPNISELKSMNSLIQVNSATRV